MRICRNVNRQIFGFFYSLVVRMKWLLELCDRKKWGMGFLASFLIVSSVGLVVIFSVCKNKDKLQSFPGGIEFIAIPKQNSNSALRIDAIQKPKYQERADRRFYDIYTSNLTEQLITIVAVIVDTHVRLMDHPLGEVDAIYPDVSYKLEYDPDMENQTFPLNKPFRIKAKSVGELRLQFDRKSDYASLPSDIFDIRLKTSDGKIYPFVE